MSILARIDFPGSDQNAGTAMFEQGVEIPCDTLAFQYVKVSKA